MLGQDIFQKILSHKVYICTYSIQGDAIRLRSGIMQCDVMRCGPLEVIFQHVASVVAPPPPLSASIHPRVSIERAGLRHSWYSSIFCTGRGADKRCRTVRTKVRVRSGGSARHNASQWGWTWLRLATILGQWTRTLRWDNGVQPARDTQIQLFPGSSPM